MQRKNLKSKPEADRLVLEPCPEPVQVMPPLENVDGPSLWLLVLGNVMVGSMLLAGLLSAPFWFAVLLNMLN